MEFRDYHDKVVLRVEGDKCYDTSGTWIYVKNGDYICNSAGNWVYVIRGTKVYDTGDNWVFNTYMYTPNDDIGVESISTFVNDASEVATHPARPLSTTSSGIKLKTYVQIAGVFVVAIIAIFVAQGMLRGDRSGAGVQSSHSESGYASTAVDASGQNLVDEGEQAPPISMPWVNPSRDNVADVVRVQVNHLVRLHNRNETRPAHRIQCAVGQHFPSIFGTSCSMSCTVAQRALSNPYDDFSGAYQLAKDYGYGQEWRPTVIAHVIETFKNFNWRLCCHVSIRPNLPEDEIAAPRYRDVFEQYRRAQTETTQAQAEVVSPPVTDSNNATPNENQMQVVLSNGFVAILPRNELIAELFEIVFELAQSRNHPLFPYDNDSLLGWAESINRLYHEYSTDFVIDFLFNSVDILIDNGY